MAILCAAHHGVGIFGHQRRQVTKKGGLRNLATTLGAVGSTGCFQKARVEQLCSGILDPAPSSVARSLCCDSSPASSVSAMIDSLRRSM